ncbi:MAG: NAD(P)/FAD-dependent oxidoreductase [Chloroflexia bacterium]|nr:NAD(P)/FAD-dependent oxidoreductase [Chloroflexia bacterium]
MRRVTSFRKIPESGVVETATQETASSAAQVDQYVSVADTVRPTVAARGKPHVVIVGSGFAGLNAAKGLADAPVKVTVIDRRNHHLFAPLLYQVATAQLSPANIAQPIRSILRKQKNANVLLGEVTGIDTQVRTVALEGGRILAYDFLVVAVGATHSYFGHDEWAPMAPGLKTIDDATEIRKRILLAFEHAENESDPARREAMLTFVVIGGGPTGVELAGAIGEIAGHTLVKEFQNIDPRDSKILLLEGLPRILPMFPEALSVDAEKDLATFGVQVRTNSLVTAIDGHGVNIGDERIDANTVIWAAGVQVSKLTQALRDLAELDRAGRVPVERELHIASHPEIFVVGDAASVTTPDGKPVPGVAPAAMQEGKWAAANIARAVNGHAYTPFKYQDKGSLATIGRHQAVASVKGRNFNGFPAWWMWMVVHVFYLNGLRNRTLVISQWAFSYFSFGRNARLITGEQPKTVEKTS